MRAAGGKRKKRVANLRRPTRGQKFSGPFLDKSTTKNIQTEGELRNQSRLIASFLMASVVLPLAAQAAAKTSPETQRPLMSKIIGKILCGAGHSCNDLGGITSATLTIGMFRSYPLGA